jgi:hypothetical protein
MTRVGSALIVAGLLATNLGAAPSTTQETLSEVERLKVELLEARTAYAKLRAAYDGCKAEVGSAFAELGPLREHVASEHLTAEEAALKASVEQAHPGYTWDPKTKLFTKQK